jgi:site-specific recombinase XerD
MDIIGGFTQYMHAVNARPTTITMRRKVLTRFEREVVSLCRAERHDIDGWLAQFTNPQTRSSYLGCLRALYRWAVRVDLTDLDPTHGIDSPRIPRRLPRPISEPDLARALLAADERMAAWITLAAYAGLRCSEIAPMRGEHIHQAYIEIPEQKGGDQATVPMTAKVAAALAAFPTEGPLWADHELGAATVSQLAVKHFRKLGMVPDARQPRRRDPPGPGVLSRDQGRLTDEVH